MKYIPKKNDIFKATDAIIGKLHRYSPFKAYLIEESAIHCHNIQEKEMDFILKTRDWNFEKVKETNYGRPNHKIH